MLTIMKLYYTDRVEPPIVNPPNIVLNRTKVPTLAAIAKCYCMLSLAQFENLLCQAANNSYLLLLIIIIFLIIIIIMIFKAIKQMKASCMMQTCVQLSIIISQ